MSTPVEDRLQSSLASLVAHASTALTLVIAICILTIVGVILLIVHAVYKYVTSSPSACPKKECAPSAVVIQPASIREPKKKNEPRGSGKDKRRSRASRRAQSDRLPSKSVNVELSIKGTHDAPETKKKKEDEQFTNVQYMELNKINYTDVCSKEKACVVEKSKEHSAARSSEDSSGIFAASNSEKAGPVCVPQALSLPKTSSAKVQPSPLTESVRAIREIDQKPVDTQPCRSPLKSAEAPNNGLLPANSPLLASPNTVVPTSTTIQTAVPTPVTSPSAFQTAVLKSSVAGIKAASPAAETDFQKAVQQSSLATAASASSPIAVKAKEPVPISDLSASTACASLTAAPPTSPRPFNTLSTYEVVDKTDVATAVHGPPSTPVHTASAAFETAVQKSSVVGAAALAPPESPFQTAVQQSSLLYQAEVSLVPVSVPSSSLRTAKSPAPKSPIARSPASNQSSKTKTPPTSPRPLNS